MNKTVTSAQLREQNAGRVLKYVYDLGDVSRQELVQALGISLPTVTRDLRCWVDRGVVTLRGHYDSTGGRRAQIYSFNGTQRVAVGISVRREYFHICAVDLYGRAVLSLEEQIPFSETEEYFALIGSRLEGLIIAAGLKKEQVLGVSLAVQGLVSPDGESILFGRILGCDGTGILRRFSRYIPYECSMMHDTEASALAEIFHRKEMKNAVLLYLNRHFGGAAVTEGRVYQDSGFSSSVIEHMTLHPGGLRCYCGRRGCIEAYCSAEALGRRAGKKLPEFFAAVRDGEEKAGETWEEYLRELAAVIGNLRMVMDTEFILCGDMIRFVTDQDLTRLREKVDAGCAFEAAPVRIGKSGYTEDAAAIGAGISLTRPYVQALLNMKQE